MINSNTDFVNLRSTHCPIFNGKVEPSSLYKWRCSCNMMTQPFKLIPTEKDIIHCYSRKPIISGLADKSPAKSATVTAFTTVQPLIEDFPWAHSRSLKIIQSLGSSWIQLKSWMRRTELEWSLMSPEFLERQTLIIIYYNKSTDANNCLYMYLLEIPRVIRFTTPIFGYRAAVRTALTTVQLSEYEFKSLMSFGPLARINPEALIWPSKRLRIP